VLPIGLSVFEVIATLNSLTKIVWVAAYRCAGFDFSVGFLVGSSSTVLDRNVEDCSYPLPNSPNIPPGEGWEWRGSGSPESGKGNYWNPGTGQSLHPDLNHPEPKGPHWGLQNPDGTKWDWFPDKGWQQCK
jgi:hypothetical protein